MASRNGWEGRVTVGLRVESDGHLSHLQIVQTSGHDILDRAALNSLRKIPQLTEVTHWLDGHSFDMVIPVQYALQDG